MSDSIACSLNGTTDQPIRLTTNVKIGERTKIIGLALLGLIVSLTSNLKPSDKGCNKP